MSKCWETDVRRISRNTFDDVSTLDQVMAWCHHYLKQCWPRFMSLYKITRPQWVNPHWHRCQWAPDLLEFLDCCIFQGPIYGLTHWGQVTHICVSKSTIIASDNGLSPDRCQAIIWTNAAILQIGLLRTNFSEILMEIQTFSFRKIYLKRSSAKWRPSCLSLNVLMQDCTISSALVMELLQSCAMHRLIYEYIFTSLPEASI